MKKIDTRGITYLQAFEGLEQWYWGTDYSCGDLYEAEEVFRSGEEFQPNRLIFVEYPSGQVYEPMQAAKGQYFGEPSCIDGEIYFLFVDFAKGVIGVYVFLQNTKAMQLHAEIPISEVEDCYNLKIDGSPMMVTRQGGENRFQVIWPEKVDFAMEERSGFMFRKGEKLYFSMWHEDPDYREEIHIRAYPSGKLLEIIDGSAMRMPNGERWVLA